MSKKLDMVGRSTGVAPTVHKTDPGLLKGWQNVALIGCGGNGSQMLTKLARLHFTLCAADLKNRLMVYAFDPDKVTRANVGRQMFSPSDIGHYKATVLINRINGYYGGVDWVAVPQEYNLDTEVVQSAMRPDLAISCVDSAKARRELETLFLSSEHLTPTYWLDLGNGRDLGQVVLGQPGVEGGLPTVMDIFPEMRDPNCPEDNDEPSCSVADALTRQALFVNDFMSTAAALLCDNLLRVGELRHHAYFINMATGQMNPKPVPAVAGNALAKTRRKVA